jgi:glycosyltransferase involved in cell wall biosynthesis
VVHNYRVPLAPKEIRALVASRRPLVYEFDDAVWADPPFPVPHALDATERRRRLVSYLRVARAVIAGNEFLASFARQYCADVIVVPTCFDIARFSPPPMPVRNDPPVIGWIGSVENQFYLRSILPALRRLAASGVRFRLRVVCSEPFGADGLAVENVAWDLATDVDAIRSFDVGVMPLTDDEFSRGKCAAKAIQCMLCGVPVVVSPVGANCEAVRHGTTGFWARTEEEWAHHLHVLLQDADLRRRMGVAAREDAARRYSQADAARVVGDLYMRLAAKGGA